MKSFFKKTVVFSVCCISFFALLEITLNYVIIYLILNKNIEHVMGHSHSECAFNDEYIPHFKNLSSSGESYFYTC